MSAVDFDVIIIGQGIAGTSLAWTLHMAGKRVLVFDENKPHTSSKIAAGLITPITGKRFVLSQNYEKYYNFARTFYRQLEKRVNKPLFQETVSKRYVRTREEKEFWAKRVHDPEYTPYIAGILEESEGFAMKCAQLDVAHFLETAHEHLDITTQEIWWDRDIVFHEDHVEMAGLSASYVVSCEGYGASQNPYFSWVPFNAAKGEILSARFSENRPADISHFGLWMAPLKEKNCFSIGATYDWNRLDGVPTEEGRGEIVRRLSEFTDTDFEVLSHNAAVRPIIFQSMAVIGTHPEYPRLAFFNGLGSKGSLHAPFFAQILMEALIENGVIDPDSDVKKYWPDE